ncbi:MAG: hypothetical protein KBD46_02680 [Candidatus Levybacteria bacterium]|nr:hypothetical protein [Candidatus Levybacteria bacterium]
MIPPFVKKFDFRGVYNTDITDRDSYYLGLALSQTLSPKKVLIGWDTRLSSKQLALRFMNALKTKGVTVVYTNECPIDYVTAGANALAVDLSVMFTGSHNPWNWTGLLMHTKGGESITGILVEEILKNYTDVQNEPYVGENTPLSDFENITETLETLYTEKLKTLIPLKEIKPFSILVDIGDGSGDKALKLLEKLLPYVTFEKINNRGVYDADSSHTADPSNLENMQDLITGMKEKSYDAGFAFDSDADRVLGVDETGNYLNGSLLGSAIVDVFSKLQFADTKFGYAVDCGVSFYNTVKQHKNCTVQPLPVGRSLMRNMIKDNTIDVAIENVGHFYIRDFFMTDSAVFTIAVLLYWMSTNGSISSLAEKHPDGQREQLFVPLSETSNAVSALVFKKLQELYPNQEIKKIEVDGIRFEVKEKNELHTWFSMRQSGYEKIQKYFFGSLNKETFGTLQKTIKEALAIS